MRLTSHDPSLKLYFERELTALDYSLEKIEKQKPPQCRIEIQTFGDFRCTINDQEPSHDNYALQSRRLLAYFINNSLISQKGVRKTRIIDDLWQDGSLQFLDKRFRQTLYRLRKTFNGNGEDNNFIIKSDENELYKLSFPSQVFCDANRFAEHYKKGNEAKLIHSEFQTVTEFEMAVRLYRGDFLSNFDEIWSQPLRSRLQSDYSEMIDCLCEFYWNRKEYSMIVGYAQQFNRLVLYDEMGLFWLIKGLLGQRKRCVAEVEYRNWTKQMEEELELEPELTYEDIKQAKNFRELGSY